MSRIKIFCGVIAAAMIFFSSICSAATDDSANAKLARIEIDTYGAEQPGALLDRISRLEKSYSGRNMTGNMNARIDAIYNTLYDNSAGPCVLAKVNALEWNINHEVRSDGIDKRLEILEMSILGKATPGTFNERIRELAKASFGAENLPVAQVQIPVNTLIKVATAAPAGTKILQEGDTLPFVVIEDVYVNGTLVFTRGLNGEGTVVNVIRAKNIFSNGKLEVDFHTLKTIDGQSAVTFTGVEALDEMKKYEMARGLSLNGHTFSGKTGDIEEVFIRGKNIELPAGIEMFVQIKEPLIVYGLSMSGNDGVVTTQPQPVTENPPLVIETRPQPVTEMPPVVTEQQPQPVTENPPFEIVDDEPVTRPQPPINEPEGLSDDEKIATPPPPPPVEEPKPVEETKPVETKPVEQKPAPQPIEQKPAPKPQPEPTVGDDVEVIEIYDE